MRKLSIITASVGFLMAAPAMAADLGVPRAAPAVAAPSFSWTGFYLGYNTGAARGDLRSVLTAHDTKGMLAGGQIGYNWQTGPWVIGIEADYDWARITGNTPACLTLAINCESRLRSIGTVRGKLGYAVNNMMWYATGGFAYGDQRFTVSVPALALELTESRFISGWTAGAGMAWAPWGNNIVTHIEALYFSMRDDGGLFGVRHNGMMLRTGLSYKFDWSRPVAVMASY